VKIILLDPYHVRFECFDLSSDLSLCEVAQVVSQKWNLVHVKLDFIVADEGSDVPATIEKTRLLGDLSLAGKELFLRTAPTHMAIRFQVPERNNETFVMGLAESSTVGAAKAQIKRHLGIGSEAITISLSGSSLRDEFGVKKLEIGGQTLVVSLKMAPPSCPPA
jgi:hypothetical protein